MLLIACGACDAESTTHPRLLIGDFAPLRIFAFRNQNLCINAAKSIGCQITNVHASDLIEGREHPHIILGIIWQIIKIQLLKAINLTEHPELYRLLEEGEELANLMALPGASFLI